MTDTRDLTTNNHIQTVVDADRRIALIEQQLKLIGSEMQHTWTLITEKMDVLGQKVQEVQATLGSNGHSVPTQLALIQEQLSNLQKARDEARITLRGVFLQSVPGLLTAAMLAIFWLISIIATSP